MDSHTTGPGFKTRYFLSNFRLTTTIAASYRWAFVAWCVCVEGRRRISHSGMAQHIKIGSCVFQCGIITSMNCTATGRPCVCLFTGCVVVSCVCGIAFLCGSTLVEVAYHSYKQGPSWYDLRCLKATLNPNKQTVDRVKMGIPFIGNPFIVEIVRLFKYKNMYACIINIYVPHDQISTCNSQEDFPNDLKWTRC